MDYPYELCNYKAERTSFATNVFSGDKSIGLFGALTFHQLTNGMISFDMNDNLEMKYYIVAYEWNGSSYSVVTDSSGLNLGGGILGGTLLGNLAADYIGTTNTTSVSKKIEENTPALMTLQDAKTGKLQRIAFQCNSMIDSVIKCMDIFPVRDASEIQNEYNYRASVYYSSNETSRRERNELESQNKIKEEKKAKNNGWTLSLLSMIFGIVGVIGSCFIVGIILDILAVFFALMANKYPDYKESTYCNLGGIMGAVGIVISIVAIAFYNEVW